MTLLRYQPGPILGYGTRTVVHACTDLETGDSYALKTPRLDQPRPAYILTGRAIARAAHRAWDLRADGIARVIDIGPEMPDQYIDGTWTPPYVVTDLVPGDDLTALVDYRQAAEAVASIADTLTTLHATGVVAMDLRPSAARLSADRPVLLDLDHATATGTRALRWRPATNAAPEITKCRPVDHRTDIHAAGALLAELLYRAQPHGGTDSLLTALACITIRATAANPDDRHQIAQDLADAIRATIQTGARHA